MKTVKEWILSVQDREVRDFLLERWDGTNHVVISLKDAIGLFCKWLENKELI